MKRLCAFSLFHLILLMHGFVYAAAEGLGSVLNLTTGEKLDFVPGIVLKRLGRAFPKGREVSGRDVDEINKKIPLVTFYFPPLKDIETEKKRSIFFYACREAAVIVFNIISPKSGQLFYLKRDEGRIIAREFSKTMQGLGYKRVRTKNL